jgi:NADPH2:quinone reductase
VHVAYDSVGKDTWEKSLRCLRPRGMLVLFGGSSGPVPPFDAQILAQQGSLFLTRPTLATYVLTRDELLSRAQAVLGAVERGDLKLRIETALPLSEAAEAHRLLASRKTTGKLLLLP